MADGLQRAWELRRALKLDVRAPDAHGSLALRWFHGPGDAAGVRELEGVAIDEYSPSRDRRFAWVTEWETSRVSAPLEEIARFLKDEGFQGAVVLERPKQGLPALPRCFFGNVSEERFTVREGRRQFHIQLLGARHPGLFLDHRPLRDWLQEHSANKRVLNLFAYTGSLSVAAGLGQAQAVTTIDLSKATVDWARENWLLNGLSPEAGRFFAGDVFEELPRLERRKEQFDCVVLDPPSFSRSKKGTFSTQKDWGRLHDRVFPLLAPGGILISSMNSAQISQARVEEEIDAAAQRAGVRLQVLRRMDLPESFPTDAELSDERYLKGAYFRVL